MKRGVPYYGQIHGLITVKKRKDGNERVIAMLITTSQDICIINAYMPTCNTDSQYEYRECLDIIFDIIQKYQETHKIILCGDLNGTLLDSRNNKHDKILKSSVSEMGRSTGVNKDERPTFFHHAWSSSSQIDYILVNDKNLISKYNIDDKSSINLSAHTSVTVKSTIEIPAITKPANKNKKAKFKLQWDKMDKRQYNNLIQQYYYCRKQCQHSDGYGYKQPYKSREYYNSKKLLQLKGPKWKASPEVQILLRSCRDLYKQWQEVGKQKDHPMATTLRNKKRKLRSKIRMEQAVSRQNLYQQIMDNPNSQYTP
ncbi:E3.1.11.2 [Mytilus coruscus]|uniref:E3.1.11.2 n=1 Tax=Mytilus coruscus TaxID=42192 RepID=A0A6J8B2H4_MYTCO|nr:E3.1.11.2 [Mytilus coruscus]